jgi:protein-S-isoprenylcysteine O-methyltransferase Ste14
MYAAHIFFLKPGVSLLINNALVFLSVFFTYLIFMILIPKEERLLEANFQAEYLRYKTETVRLFPKLINKD